MRSVVLDFFPQLIPDFVFVLEIDGLGEDCCAYSGATPESLLHRQFQFIVLEKQIEQFGVRRSRVDQLIVMEDVLQSVGMRVAHRGPRARQSEMQIEKVRIAELELCPSDRRRVRLQFFPGTGQVVFPGPLAVRDTAVVLVRVDEDDIHLTGSRGQHARSTKMDHRLHNLGSRASDCNYVVLHRPTCSSSSDFSF